MIKSFLLSCLIFTFISNTSSQKMPLMGNELQSLFTGNLNNKVNPEIANRSGIRAVLDTVKVFRQTGDFIRPHSETHYGFDSRFNINFTRYLSWRSSHERLIPLFQTKKEYHSSGQIMFDTSYNYSIIDGIWINDRSIQNKFDAHGNVVVTRFDEWDEIFGKWHVSTITDRIFNNSLLVNESTRRSNGEGGSANLLSIVNNWEYDDSQRWTKFKHFLNASNKLILNLYYKREFDDNGNLRYFYDNDIADPERISNNSKRHAYFYDEQNRLIQEIITTSSFPLQQWRLSSKNTFEYNANNKVEKKMVEFRDSISDGWVLQSYIEYEFDAYGNITLETHYKIYSNTPGTYIADKSVEYFYDLNYGPGTFVANVDVDHAGHMLTNSVTTQYGGMDPVITTKEYIYKVLESNAAENIQPESVHIFPNPFSDYVHIDTKFINIPDLTIEIYSNNGMLCLKQIAHPNETVSVSQLIPGSYHILLLDSNGKILGSKKMIKW